MCLLFVMKIGFQQMDGVILEEKYNLKKVPTERMDCYGYRFPLTRGSNRFYCSHTCVCVCVFVPVCGNAGACATGHMCVICDMCWHVS